MNHLNKTLIILLVFITASGFAISSESNEKIIKEVRIEVIFNRLTKFNDLVKIKFDLAEKGITLEYKKLEFDENGGLVGIDFKVDCNDGFKGSSQNLKLTNQSKFGFFRDYSKTSSSAFGTGNLE